MEIEDLHEPIDEVMESSQGALTSSNDDTSHPSISEPQPTVSSQDVAMLDPNSTQPMVVESSHGALTSSNDNTGLSSISEPQPTVSSQDVSVPDPNSSRVNEDRKRTCEPGTSRLVKIARLSPTQSSNSQGSEGHAVDNESEMNESHNLNQGDGSDVRTIPVPGSNSMMDNLSQLAQSGNRVLNVQVNVVENKQTVEKQHVINQPQEVHINSQPESSNIDLQKLVEELKELLKRIISEFLGESLLPPGVPDRIIDPVPLQISKVRQMADDEWDRHGEQRKDWQRMYTPEGSIRLEELFNVAKQTAEQEADMKCKVPEAKSNYIKRYGNCVGAVGLPGIGKSTLTKIIAKHIVKDKTMKPDAEFIFPISLKNFNPDKEISLLEFLLHDSWSEWNHSDEENQALIQFLYNNPNVLLLIDGLDELNTSQVNKRSYTCQLNSKETPEVFVKNLLMGKLLPNAVKVITSRPGQFYELHPDYRQYLVTEVRGMDKPARKNLTKQICGEANLENVEKLLAERPNLDALCYIPVHCIQIVACLHSSVSLGREINSMTQVFIHTLTNYKASDHVRTNLSDGEIERELVKLAHLAYTGLASRKLMFQKNDFEEVGINEQTVEIFLHTYVEKSNHLKMKILEGKKRSFFTHLTWQEFFAAVHLMLFMPQEDFRRCMNTFKEFHWEVVTRFIFGMCNSTSYEDLKVIFPASMIKDYEDKKNILKTLILYQDLIRFSGWVHEANDAEISQRFDECMTQCIKMDVPRNLTEVSDVVFAFNTFTTPHSLMLTEPFTDKTLFETWLRGMHGSCTKIKELHIANVEMTDSCTHALLPHLDVMSYLLLDEKKLSVQSLIMLHEAIQRLRYPQHLTVNGIDGDRWSNYWKLYRRQTDDDVMQVLKLPPGKFKRLNIRNVKMTDSLTQALLPHLDVMIKLTLDEKKLSLQNRFILHEAVEHLANPQVNYSFKNGIYKFTKTLLSTETRNGLTVNNISGDRWAKDWEIYWDQTIYDVIQILQLPTGKIKELHTRRHVKMTESTTQALLPHLNVMDQLYLDERENSVQNRIILREAVERLTNPQVSVFNIHLRSGM
ncbi:uncharacterized protein LOC108950749 [Ciona intestinalis]